MEEKNKYLDKKIDHERFYFTSAEMIDFFGFTNTTRFYSLMRKKGAPDDIRIKQGLYDARKTHRWLISQYKDNLHVERSMDEEKLRYQKARSDREEIVAKELAKDLLPVKKIIEDLSFVFATMRQYILTWHKRLPAILVGHTEREMSELIRAEVNLLLSDLSKGIKNILPKKKRKTKK